MRVRCLPSCKQRPDEDDEQAYEDYVAYEDEPGHGLVEVQRVVPVLLREPRLREQERGDEENGGERPVHEHDERDEPDQELRRQHLAEGDER